MKITSKFLLFLTGIIVSIGIIISLAMWRGYGAFPVLGRIIDKELGIAKTAEIYTWNPNTSEVKAVRQLSPAELQFVTGQLRNSRTSYSPPIASTVEFVIIFFDGKGAPIVHFYLIPNTNDFYMGRLVKGNVQTGPELHMTSNDLSFRNKVLASFLRR